MLMEEKYIDLAALDEQRAVLLAAISKKELDDAEKKAAAVAANPKGFPMEYEYYAAVVKEKRAAAQKYAEKAEAAKKALKEATQAAQAARAAHNADPVKYAEEQMAKLQALQKAKRDANDAKYKDEKKKLADVAAVEKAKKNAANARRAREKVERQAREAKEAVEKAARNASRIAARNAFRHIPIGEQNILVQRKKVVDAYQDNLVNVNTTLEEILKPLINVSFMSANSASETVVIMGELATDPYIKVFLKIFDGIDTTKGLSAKYIHEKHSGTLQVQAEYKIYNELYKLRTLRFTPNVLARVGTFKFEPTQGFFFEEPVLKKINNFKKYFDGIGGFSRLEQLPQLKTWETTMCIMTCSVEYSLFDILSSLPNFEVFKGILYQIMHLLTWFEHIEMAHHDLHTGNIRVEKHDQPIDLYYQHREGRCVHLKTKYVVKVYDFDRSTIYKQTDLGGGVIVQPVSNYNTGYLYFNAKEDAFKVLRHLMYNRNRDSISWNTPAQELIKRLIPYYNPDNKEKTIAIGDLYKNLPPNEKILCERIMERPPCGYDTAKEEILKGTFQDYISKINKEFHFISIPPRDLWSRCSIYIPNSIMLPYLEILDVLSESFNTIPVAGTYMYPTPNIVFSGAAAAAAAAAKKAANNAAAAAAAKKAANNAAAAAAAKKAANNAAAAKKAANNAAAAAAKKAANNAAAAAAEKKAANNAAAAAAEKKAANNAEAEAEEIRKEQKEREDIATRAFQQIIQTTISDDLARSERNLELAKVLQAFAYIRKDTLVLMFAHLMSVHKDSLFKFVDQEDIDNTQGRFQYASFKMDPERNSYKYFYLIKNSTKALLIEFHLSQEDEEYDVLASKPKKIQIKFLVPEKGLKANYGNKTKVKWVDGPQLANIKIEQKDMSDIATGFFAL